MHLHPALRAKVATLIEKLNGQGLHFELSDGFRSPTAQLLLYARGRLDKGAPVTFAKPWSTAHSFGLAADLVLIVDGKPDYADLNSYRQMQRVAQEIGLKIQGPPMEDLPHVQLDGIDLSQVKLGNYPTGGDEPWSSNLTKSIENWNRLVQAITAWGSDLPKAPPPPGGGQ